MSTVTLGRVRILDRPIVPPGKCCMCGSATKPVVDFGLDVYGYGAVYFCLDDVRELGRAVGLLDKNSLERSLTPQELLSLVDSYCKSTNHKLVTGELYDGLRGVADLLNRSSLSKYTSSPVINSEPKDTSSVTGPSEQVESANSGPVDGTTESYHQLAIGEGTDGVPDTTGFDFNFGTE